MITLYQPPSVWGLPNMSPFCAKLETYLRMTKLEYRTVDANPMKAPKGKIPYVLVDGKLMGDSGLIIDYLKATRGDPLDARLTAEQKALALVVRRTVEEFLFFGAALERWQGEASWGYLRTAFAELLPPLLSPLILRMIRRDIVARARAQGIGVHTPAERLAFAREDLSAIATLLGEKPYFFGDEPASIDAVLYSFLIQVLWVPWESEFTRLAKSFPNLEDYCRRMKGRYWQTV